MDIRTAIVPGSFDPLTVGHLDIIKRTSKLFDKVYVAVMINKEKSYIFSDEERVEIARLSCLGIENVEVLFDDGMLFDLAKRLNAKTIVKGVRNLDDYEYEKNMAFFNKDKNPDVDTVFLYSNKEYENISSSEVRKRLNKNESVEDLLSKNAIEYIEKLNKKF